MNQKSVLKKVLAYIKKYNIYMILSIIAATITVVSTLYFPILTGDAVDMIISKGNVDFVQIKKIIVKMLIVIVVTAIAQWIMNVSNNKMAYAVVKDIREKAFRKLQNLPLKYIDSNPYGDIVSRIVADVDQFSDGLLMGFTQLFTGVITIFGTLLFMFTINVRITLVVIVITPLSLVVASFIAKSTYNMFKEQSVTRGEQTSFIEEMIGNQKIVQAFGHEDEAIEKFDEINKRLCLFLFILFR